MQHISASHDQHVAGCCQLSKCRLRLLLEGALQQQRQQQQQQQGVRGVSPTITTSMQSSAPAFADNKCKCRQVVALDNNRRHPLDLGHNYTTLSLCHHHAAPTWKIAKPWNSMSLSTSSLGSC
jgi:hypothetical protein